MVSEIWLSVECDCRLSLLCWPAADRLPYALSPASAQITPRLPIHRQYAEEANKLGLSVSEDAVRSGFKSCQSIDCPKSRTSTSRMLTVSPCLVHSVPLAQRETSSLRPPLYSAPHS